MTTQNRQADALPSTWLDRAVWIAGILLVLTTVGFGVFYYFDRYVHPNEPLVERQTRHFEALVREDPANPTLRVAVARGYLRQGLIDQAIQQGMEALKLDEGNIDALILLAEAYLAKGDEDQALATLEQVVALNRDNPFADIDRRMNFVYYDLGELYYKRGEYDQAIEALKEALKVDRTDADARYLLGLTYQVKGDHQLAVREFHEALRYVPDFAEVYQGLKVSYEALGMRTEAAYAEAMVAFTQGKYEQAAQQLKAVLREAPDYDPAYLGLGLTYEKLGDAEKAVAALQRYLDTHPDSLAARHALGRLGVSVEGQ